MIADVALVETRRKAVSVRVLKYNISFALTDCVTAESDSQRTRSATQLPLQNKKRWLS
jgi:hypothetical protein